MENRLIPALNEWGSQRDMWMNIMNHALYAVADGASRRCLDNAAGRACPFCLEGISLNHFSTIGHAQAVQTEWMSMGGNMDALELVISIGWMFVGHKDFKVVTGDSRPTLSPGRAFVPRTPRMQVPQVTYSECPICYEIKDCPKIVPCGLLVCPGCWPMCRGRCPLRRAVGVQILLI